MGCDLILVERLCGRKRGDVKAVWYESNKPAVKIRRGVGCDEVLTKKN